MVIVTLKKALARLRLCYGTIAQDDDVLCGVSKLLLLVVEGLESEYKQMKVGATATVPVRSGLRDALVCASL